MLYMLGDITSGPAYRFAQWLELVRKRSSKYRASGFPHRPHHTESMPLRFVFRNGMRLSVFIDCDTC